MGKRESYYSRCAGACERAWVWLSLARTPTLAWNLFFALRKKYYAPKVNRQQVFSNVVDFSVAPEWAEKWVGCFSDGGAEDCRWIGREWPESYEQAPSFGLNGAPNELRVYWARRKAQ